MSKNMGTFILDTYSEIPASVNVPLHGSSYLSVHNDSSDMLEGSSRERGNPVLVGKVIHVEGDGRCLFRSLVTAESPRLQATRRDDLGRPESKEDSAEETVKADELRARVIKLMRDNLHFYSQLENGVINADQPVRYSYQKFLDRLEAMSKFNTMPGDLELNAAAMVLERQIVVLNTDLRVITVYGQDRYPQCIPVAVRYTRLCPDVGHYDAVLLESDIKAIQRGAGQAGMVDYINVLCSDFFKLTLNK